MAMEFVAGLLLGVLVFGGLAFGDRIVGHLADIGSDPELVRPDDLD